MKTNPLNALCVWMLGSILLLAACAQRDGSLRHGEGQGAEIVLTGAGPASPIASGQSAVFKIVVSNNGPHDATKVRIVDTIGKQSKLVSITCTATGKATCPSPLGVAMVADSLPSAGSLEFLVTLELSSHGTGTILNSMVASIAGDADPNDNVVTNDVLVR